MCDLFADNPMIRPLELVKPTKQIDHGKIKDYNRAIDLLDTVCEQICFPGADVYRKEIYRIQREMQEKIWRLEDGTDD